MKSIRILGKVWAVKYKKGFDDEEMMGLCSQPEQTIWLLEGMPKDRERDILWHEIKHAISDEMNARLKEEQIKIMATGELAVLRDNPWLAEYLTDG